MTTPTKAQHSDISDEEHPSSRDGGSEWSTTNSEVDSHMSDNDSQSDDYVTAESRSLHDDSDDAYPSRQTSLDALEKNGVDRDSHDSRSIHSGSHSSHNDGGNVEDSRLAVPDKKAQLSNHHGDEGMDADENQISNQDGTRDNTGSQYGANTQPINDYESRNSYISLTDEVSPHNRESSLLEAKYFRSMNQAALENIERLNNLRSEVSHVGHPDLENSEDESSQYDSKPDSKGNGSPSGRTSSKTNRGGFFSFFGSKRKNEDKEETTVHPVKKAKTAEVDLTPPGDNSEDSEDSEEDGSVTSSEGTGSIEESASEEYEKDSEEEDYDEASQPKAPKRSTTAVDRPAKRQRTRGLMDKQITWQHIEVEELDLHQTYVGHNTPVKKPTQKRWQASGGEAITDPEKVPKGWTDAEPDLDEEDIEAQIARCEQRIEDKILPALFAMKLQGLRKKKAEKEYVLRQ
ncbi:hypothetical protein N7470_008729 [Penicillium chermesinum]|nr:hypothetical protein N7470_008729 [Penicillium chermesinum]